MTKDIPRLPARLFRDALPHSVRPVLSLPGSLENGNYLGYERVSRGFSALFLDCLVIHCHWQSGTRVFYWGANGEINYGTVQSTSRMADVSVGSELSTVPLPTTITQGTQILVIREDSGKNTTLP